MFLSGSVPHYADMNSAFAIFEAALRILCPKIDFCALDSGHISSLAPVLLNGRAWACVKNKGVCRSWMTFRALCEDLFGVD